MVFYWGVTGDQNRFILSRSAAEMFFFCVCISVSSVSISIDLKKKKEAKIVFLNMTYIYIGASGIGGIFSRRRFSWG